MGLWGACSLTTWGTRRGPWRGLTETALCETRTAALQAPPVARAHWPLPFAEIMLSNGFCLANTETIVIDHSIPHGKSQHLAVGPAEHL